MDKWKNQKERDHRGAATLGLVSGWMGDYAFYNAIAGLKQVN